MDKGSHHPRLTTLFGNFGAVSRNPEEGFPNREVDELGAFWQHQHD